MPFDWSLPSSRWTPAVPMSLWFQVLLAHFRLWTLVDDNHVGVDDDDDDADDHDQNHDLHHSHPTKKK